MQKRTLSLIVALTVLVLSVPARALDEQRPVTGTLDGYDEYGLPGSCGGGLGFTLTSTAFGQVAHLGRAVMVSPVCLASDYSVIGEWRFTITGANGDTVSGVVTDWAYTSYGFDLFATVTGGTGRFDGATGDLTFPTLSSGTGVWSSTIEGWISY
jgi:hypothetical protein